MCTTSPTYRLIGKNDVSPAPKREQIRLNSLIEETSQSAAACNMFRNRRLPLHALFAFTLPAALVGHTPFDFRKASFRKPPLTSNTLSLLVTIIANAIKLMITTICGIECVFSLPEVTTHALEGGVSILLHVDTTFAN